MLVFLKASAGSGFLRTLPGSITALDRENKRESQQSDVEALPEGLGP